MNLFIAGLLLCYGTIVLANDEKSKTRIANQGEVAYEGEFPYQVSIQIYGRHTCGGSLITTSHVLTAAHCVQKEIDFGRFPGPVTIEVGTVYIGWGTSHKVKRISYYRGYRGSNIPYIYPNDIAMIHLATPVIISNRVATINLPAPNTPLPGRTPVILSGFGNSHYNGPTSPVLKKMSAVIVSAGDCYQYYLNNLRLYLTTDKICAARGPGYGACQGDSGGPLVDQTKKTVIGVVSAGDAQCSNGYPDTYTDVSRFIPYIYEELNYETNPGPANQNPAINFNVRLYGTHEKYPSSWYRQQPS